MAAYNKTLQLLANKLGLGDEDKVLGKAAELERLLQTKSTAGSNIPDTSKVVICLDLAAAYFGVDLDSKTAIKYSGLKPVMYTNCRKTVENLLELNSDKLTVAILCASLQCPNVQDLADTILLEYQKQVKMDVDLNLPHYVCMAVYQACRINKVKVSKSQFLEKCRLKPAQWSKLDAEWTKVVDAHFTVTKKKGRPKKVEKNEENIEAMDVDGVSPKKELPGPQTETYEEWKHRILEAAYKELAEVNKQRKMEKKILEIESMSPRRSPRKTPQKFSPYKSPVKGNGVRLLFPLGS